MVSYKLPCEACGEVVDLYHEVADDGDGPICPYCCTPFDEAFPSVDPDELTED